MNPQNMASHVSDRHSLLWRIKMFEEIQPIKKQVCHRQLNELAQTGQFWRTRNNLLKTSFSQFSDRNTYKKATKSVVIDNILSPNRQSKLTQGMLNSLATDGPLLQKSRKLIEGMQDLKEMKLLSAKDLQKTKFPGIIRHQHVYNDYHTRETNPGYSRNYMGKFYTK